MSGRLRFGVVEVLVAAVGLLAAAEGWAEDKKKEEEKPSANAERLKWWQDARFGMFIHWGPVALKGTEIGWSRGAQVPIEEYDSLYKKFNPTKFDADAWARLARDAGMKYVVLTTKHHDGFCLFDTKQTDFNVMNSPFKRDVTKELAEACRKHGLAFGTYHSVCDWHHPDFPLGSPGGKTKKPNPNLDRYEQYLRAQVTELIKNYGPLHVMWFDVPQEFDARRGGGVLKMVRELQPDILVNDRISVPADYSTPEQRVGGFTMKRPWETCMTIASQWAWKPNDPVKSLEQCLRTLVRCAGGDGNLLFNVGPKADGEIEPEQADRLRQMGAWLAKYGESVYGTRGGPYMPTARVASTRKGNTVYVHVFDWDGDSVTLPPLPRKVTAATLLTGGQVKAVQDDKGLTLTVGAGDRREADTIVKLELDGPALEITPIRVGGGTVKATASNTFHNSDEHGPEMAVDGDPHTRWATDSGTRKAWLAIDLGKDTAFDGVRVQEAYPGRVRKFAIEVQTPGGEWKPVHSGTTLGADFRARFTPVVARHARLNILEATEGPTIWEIRVVEAKDPNK